MTRDEFKAQSDELFFKIFESFLNKFIEEGKDAFEKTKQNEKIKDLNIMMMDVFMQMITSASRLSFEASADYAEKLSLLLFDNFSSK